MSAATATRSPLTKAQALLLMRLRDKRMAFKGARGWRFQGDPVPVQRVVGEGLITRHLAVEEAGHGAARLRLTADGAKEAERLALRRRRAR
ncbi:hypothetical protein H1W37_19330 [Stappia taiwanensis]|uniref:Uncharacterized protein n=1 Tax=Stappia taiwanensis TaxID=992267 RepID=A0A838XZF0_9HYPH|nr:hypothetical protein [Stappia taiwanensis]MBA4613816.1 hypothetical protein [Stappia taiwanensis]GGE79316.1 hypothetical protein GCM10007285_03920 [Stappia taiwanensis]